MRILSPGAELLLNQFAQTTVLQLAGGRARQFRDRANPIQPLVARQPLFAGAAGGGDRLVRSGARLALPRRFA